MPIAGDDGADARQQAEQHRIGDGVAVGCEEVHAVVDGDGERAQDEDADDVPDEDGLEVVVDVLEDRHHAGVGADAPPEPARELVVVPQQVEHEHEHQEHADERREEEAGGGRDRPECARQQVPELPVEHRLRVLAELRDDLLRVPLSDADVRPQHRLVLLEVGVREHVDELLDGRPRREPDDEQHGQQHQQDGGRRRHVRMADGGGHPPVHPAGRVVHPDREHERPEHRLERDGEDDDQRGDQRDPAERPPLLRPRQVHVGN
jgi:hypothetical protein